MTSAWSGSSGPPPATGPLVARYQEVFAARFPGSSVDWVRALIGGDPPPQPGLVWVTFDAGVPVAAARVRPR